MPSIQFTTHALVHLFSPMSHWWCPDTEEEQHESSSSHEHSQTLSDGRLNVGTHLLLMAKRYAYLSLIGEGTSAQVRRS